MNGTVGLLMNTSFLYLTVPLLSNYIDRAYGSPNFDFNKASASAAILETQIELSISIKNMYGFAFVANPLCVTSIRPENSEDWTVYHTTERRYATNNTAFISKVRIPYLLKDKMELKFEVYYRYGQDNKHLPRSSMSYRGYATCKLADLLSAGKMERAIKTRTGEEKIAFGIGMGQIIVHAERFNHSRKEVGLTLRRENVNSQSIFGKSLHYVEIYKHFEKEKKDPTDEDDYIMVYRTEAMEFYQREWKPIVLSFNTFCSDNRRRKLKFVCWDRHYLVGDFETTVEEMENHETDFILQNDQKKKMNGKISVSDFYVIPVPSFSDFMAEGLKLHVTIAIDFSRKSNGPLEKPESYHNRRGENRYEKALRLVVSAFQDYTWDDKYSVRAFGARKADGTVLDDYNLGSWGEVEGVYDVLQAYRDAFKDIKLGPEANLVPSIERLTKNAETYRRSSKNYCVLVILMAGEIAKVWDTEMALLKTIGLPLSIIFVGIDDTDFDRVKGAYKAASGKNSRNILHFVSFHESDVQIDDDSNSYRKVELLAKLPEQVVSFMHSKKMKP